MKAFLTVCAAALCALTLRADDYVVLVGEEGWTQEKATEIVFQGGLPLSSVESFAALMTVTMPASADYGAVVSFGEAGVRQVTLTVVSLGTGGVAYLSSWENGDTNALLSEYRLPNGTFRANETYDIAVTFDGSQFHVYVNGAEQTLTLQSGAAHADGAPEVPAFIKGANLPDVCLGTRMSEVDAGSGTGNGNYDFVGATWRNAVVFARGLAADEVRLAHEEGLDALLNELYGPDVETDTDGARLLDSVADFRWFLSEDCPADATVRLKRDLTLTAGAYAAKPSFSGTFDGQGHTLILAEGAKLQGTEGVGLIAATLQGATVQDLDVRVEGAILSDGTAGALAGTAEDATFSDVHLTFDGTLAGDGAVGGLVGQASGLTLKGVRVDFTGAANGASAGGLLGAGALTAQDSLLVFDSGAAVGALVTATGASGAAIGEAAEGAALSGLTIVDAGLAGATGVVGSGEIAAPAALLLGEGSALLAESAEADFLSGTVNAPEAATLTLTLPEGASFAGTPSATGGWVVSGWDAATGTLTLTPPEGNLSAEGTLTYAFSLGAFGEVTFSCALSHRDAEGWYVLDSEADYAWYLADDENDAIKVRLGADITLSPKTYTARFIGGNDTLEFDGQGHTLTLPEGATVDGDGTTTGRDYSGLIAGRLKSGVIRDVTVVVGGTVVARPYAGAVVGSGLSGGGGEVLIEDVTVRLLPTGRVEAEGNSINGRAGGFVGLGYSNAVTLRDCTLIAEAGAEIRNRDAQGTGPDRPGQTAATCGNYGSGGGVEEGVAILDFGLVMPEGAPYSRDADTRAYKASTQTADFGADGVFLAGDVARDLGAPFALAPDALPVKEVTLDEASASAGWSLAREGNSVTLTGGGTGPCALTYTLEVAPETPIALSVTLLTEPVLGEDGWYTLDSEPDYAWYLANCPNNAKVRLGADIDLKAQAYTAYVPQAHQTVLEFDGQGHTITLPEGATMVGKGNDTKIDYSGVIAGQLKSGSIRDVTVIVGGTVLAKPYAGAILGSGTYTGGGEVSLSNVHVRLLPTGRVETQDNPGNGYAGGLVGRGYTNTITLTDCSLVFEAGAELRNRSEQTAAVCGDDGSNGGSVSNQGVVVVDFGLVMPEGAVYSRDEDGDTVVYRKEGLATAYGEEAIPFHDDEVEAEDFTAAVAGSGAALADVSGPEGLEATVGDGTITITRLPDEPTPSVALTYGFEGVPGLAVPVSVALPRVDADGWITLASEPDYAWYLADCPNNAKVRLAADIDLEAGKTYRAYNPKRDHSFLEFDGQGHTVTLPEGATMRGNSGNGTANVEYCGVVAGQLESGAIRDVSVVIGGEVSGSSYIGGVLGSSTFRNDNDTEVTLSGVHVHLLGTALIKGTICVGGILGYAYANPVDLADCTLAAEAGARIENSGSYTALTVGRSNNGTSDNVRALDLGVVLPEGAPYTRRATGEVVYKASTVTASHGEAETFLAGAVGGEDPWVLAPAGLTVEVVEAPEGWAATLEGNVLSLSGPGGEVALTYGFAGFPGVRVPLTLTPPAGGGYAFTLPEGAAAPSPAQSAALEAAARAAGLTPGAVTVRFAEGAAQTLEALDLFTGVVSADAEARTLTIDATLAIAAIDVASGEIAVTVVLRGPEGCAFAEGTRVALVLAEGGEPLGEPVAASREGASVQLAFPRPEASTALFRARATAAE